MAAADSIDATTSAQTITFELSASDGLSVTKTFVIEPKGYLVTFSAVVQLGQAALNPVIHWGPGLGDEIASRPPSSFFSPNSVVPAQPMIYKDGAVERVAPTEAGSQEGTFRYAGTSDHYFAGAVPHRLRAGQRAGAERANAVRDLHDVLGALPGAAREVPVFLWAQVIG